MRISGRFCCILDMYIVNSLKVLEPIASAITEIEGDQAILSDVQRLLSELEDKVGAALPQTPLLKPEEYGGQFWVSFKNARSFA